MILYSILIVKIVFIFIIIFDVYDSFERKVE